MIAWCGFGALARLRRGNDGLDVHVGDGLSQVVVVMGAVGQDELRVEAIEQVFRREIVMPVASRELEAERRAHAVADHQALVQERNQVPLLTMGP